MSSTIKYQKVVIFKQDTLKQNLEQAKAQVEELTEEIETLKSITPTPLWHCSLLSFRPTARLDNTHQYIG